jgi:hypothetical protein
MLNLMSPLQWCWRLHESNFEQTHILFGYYILYILLCRLRLFWPLPLLNKSVCSIAWIRFFFSCANYNVCFVCCITRNVSAYKGFNYDPFQIIVRKYNPSRSLVLAKHTNTHTHTHTKCPLKLRIDSQQCPLIKRWNRIRWLYGFLSYEFVNWFLHFIWTILMWKIDYVCYKFVKRVHIIIIVVPHVVNLFAEQQQQRPVCWRRRNKKKNKSNRKFRGDKFNYLVYVFQFIL